MTTARPCQEDGTFLQELPVTLTPGKDNQPVHDWTPFKDHLAFDWVHYHCVSSVIGCRDYTRLKFVVSYSIQVWLFNWCPMEDCKGYV
jgi:hypothetical protein